MVLKQMHFGVALLTCFCVDFMLGLRWHAYQ